MLEVVAPQILAHGTDLPLDAAQALEITLLAFGVDRDCPASTVAIVGHAATACVRYRHRCGRFYSASGRRASFSNPSLEEAAHLPILACRSRRPFATTLTELKAIAALAAQCSATGPLKGRGLRPRWDAADDVTACPEQVLAHRPHRAPESSIALPTPARPPRISATSVPVPTAMPTSADARAAASLAPSRPPFTRRKHGDRLRCA